METFFPWLFLLLSSLSVSFFLFHVVVSLVARARGYTQPALISSSVSCLPSSSFSSSSSCSSSSSSFSSSSSSSSSTSSSSSDPSHPFSKKPRSRGKENCEKQTDREFSLSSFRALFSARLQSEQQGHNNSIQTTP